MYILWIKIMFLWIFLFQVNRKVLTSKCRVQVAQETIGDTDFIETISKLAKDLCPFLGDTIVDKLSRQSIINAPNDGQALFLFRQVSSGRSK